MTNVNLGAQPAINWPALDAELRAALPGQLDGTSYGKGGELTVHVAEGADAEALRKTIAAVLAAHNPNVLTRQQQAEAARETAALAVRAADVTALRAGLEAKAGTVAQLQAQVAALAGVIESMRVALGLDEPPDGGRA